MDPFFSDANGAGVRTMSVLADLIDSPAMTGSASDAMPRLVIKVRREDGLGLDMACIENGRKIEHIRNCQCFHPYCSHCFAIPVTTFQAAQHVALPPPPTIGSHGPWRDAAVMD
ncbi:hypothetical protein OS187_01815 [Xanthomonadaceae bacterium JHOS43]|nr:hypothetical protein [Xanthomonadaceae bacterium JHOS43]